MTYNNISYQRTFVEKSTRNFPVYLTSIVRGSTIITFQTFLLLRALLLKTRPSNIPAILFITAHLHFLYRFGIENTKTEKFIKQNLYKSSSHCNLISCVNFIALASFEN